MVRATFAAVVMAVALAGCGGGPAPSQEFGKEDATAIRQLVSDFVAAYNAKDVDKLAGLFSGNAVIMPPNRSMLRGVELVKGYFEGRLTEEGATDLELAQLTLDGQGTLAYILTTYQLNLQPAGAAAPERFRGKVVWIVRKLGGQWRFEVQMMSGDIPPATPPAAPPDEKKK